MSVFTDAELAYLAEQRLGRRGTATVAATGGKAFGEQFEDAIVRIQPTRIVAFGIGTSERNARSVGPA